MKPELQENLQTVIEQGRLIQSFVNGISFEFYQSDEKTRLAVERCFEIIGEALNRAYKLDPETVDSITDYRKIISFRNILAHCYDSVEDRLVWGVIEESLPSLLSDVMNLIAV